MRNVVNDGFARGAGSVLAGGGGGPGIPKRPSTDDEVIRGHDHRVWNTSGIVNGRVGEKVIFMSSQVCRHLAASCALCERMH